jgi:hypothetical protein
MNLRGALLSLLLLAGTGWAATGLEAMRANAAGLRGQVGQLRSEQLAKRNELSTVSSRIEGLKAESKGKLLPGSELDQALKRSQELSGTLTELAQRLTSREVELESANVSLVEGLSAELNRLRAEFDRQADRAARKTLIDQMRKLRSEREAIRASLPATKLPALETLRPTDDPEELLEQADLLRDNEEKVRRELKALESRIAQRREEVELDRRMQRFMGEESMFDDQDRRLRLQRRDTIAGEAPPAIKTSNGNAETAGDGLSNTSITAGSAPADTRSNNQPPTFSLGGFGAPPAAARSGADFNSAPPQSPSGVASGGLDSKAISITTGSDARPQVGAGTRSIATGDEDEMDDLDVQRVKLKGIAEELKRKAQELEKKASQLR